MPSYACVISIRVSLIVFKLKQLGLKEHVIAEKRLSANPPGGPPTQMTRLTRPKREEEEPLAEDNYLHPKKPPARMSMLRPWKLC
jgi:hypothetical protein